MDYGLVRSTHQVLVVASVAGFFARWLGSAAGAGWVAARPARTLPHLLDSLLLLSGAWPAWTWGAALGGWFTARMFGLVAYVLLGVVGMRASLARPGA